MTERSLETLGTGKQLIRKVAVVTNPLSPLGEAFCLQFAREGASLLLVGDDQQGIAALAEEINTLCGFDSNYGDIGQDPWGVSLKALAVEKDALTPESVDKLVETSLDTFGQTPDLLVDTDNHLDSDFLAALSQSCLLASDEFGSGLAAKQEMAVLPLTSKSSTVTITPFENEQVFYPGWLGLLDPALDNMHEIEFTGQCPTLHVLCPESNVRFLSKGKGIPGLMKKSLKAADCNIRVRCNNLVSLLPRLTFGIAHKAPFQEVEWNNDREKDGTKYFRENSDLVMSVSIEHFSSEQETCSEMDSVDELDCQEELELSPRSPLPDLAPRNLVGQTFNSNFKKVDMLPEDVWGIVGNRGIMEKPEALRVLDDDCVLSIARSAANCSVRWLLFGYIVIMVAVPRMLGGLSV